VTEPKVHATEIRCNMRGPDGYLIEVVQTIGPRSARFLRLMGFNVSLTSWVCNAKGGITTQTALLRIDRHTLSTEPGA